MHARRFAREHAPPGIRGVGPRRIDDGARLLLDDRFGLAFEPLQIGLRDETLGLEPAGIGANGIARRPILITFAVDVAGATEAADLGILPGG